MRLIRIFSVLVAASAQGALADVPRVATDIVPVHALVSRVMEGVGAPDLVIPPGASPHGYAMRPSEARNLARADIVVWVGPALTPWLKEPLETLSGDAQRLKLMSVSGTVLLPFRSGVRFDDGHDHGAHDHDDHGHDKHSEHDDHDKHGEDVAHHDETDIGVDSHVWLDPHNAQNWVGHIADVLSAQDPENAATYRANAVQAATEIEALEGRIREMLAPVRGRPFVVSHDAFHYFEARFGAEAVASINLGDASMASASRLVAVRNAVAETGAVCVLAEPLVGDGLIAAVTENQTVSIETVDPLGVGIALGTDGYEDLLMQITTRLVACLSE